MKIVWKDRLLEKEKIVNWISDWFEENGDSETKAIIGISGGKDSTVTAALCLEALGHDRVIGVLMPNGEQADFKDSVTIVNLLDLHYETINIGEAVKEVYAAFGSPSRINNDVRINTPPRIRMTILYAVAAMYGNARVVCTDNASESYIGYSTKYGDLAGDVAPLADIPASLVVDIGRALPIEFLHYYHL
jgi:NAD+ synthase